MYEQTSDTEAQIIIAEINREHKKCSVLFCIAAAMTTAAILINPLVGGANIARTINRIRNPLYFDPSKISGFSRQRISSEVFKNSFYGAVFQEIEAYAKSVGINDLEIYSYNDPKEVKPRDAFATHDSNGTPQIYFNQQYLYFDNMLMLENPKSRETLSQKMKDQIAQTSLKIFAVGIHEIAHLQHRHTPINQRAQTLFGGEIECGLAIATAPLIIYGLNLSLPMAASALCLGILYTKAQQLTLQWSGIHEKTADFTVAQVIGAKRYLDVLYENAEPVKPHRFFRYPVRNMRRDYLHALSRKIDAATHQIGN